MIQPDLMLDSIELEDLEGQNFDIKTMLGKPLVINYWATWCFPCLEELPEMERIKQEYGDKVGFLMVSDEGLEKLQKFKNKTNYTFTFLRGKKGFEQIEVRPTTYIFDKHGALVKQINGTIDVKELKILLSTLVE
ncbi:hypothetical protein BBD32_12715 [Elizabethkingia anophelis]|uniref:Thioredoxin domain-containing protein n=2 Tax=Elizabethkingia anophelis TaxID=1117645 RepID=A0AAU8V0P9_9FLAO|nr:hypothetical protein BBD32_12715 [Elizabethkingia anophelis]OPB63788.1 hypothetical protein BAY11_16885 [Elizabethkingia anophelis]